MPFVMPNEADVAFGAQAEPDARDYEVITAGSGRTGVVTGCAVTAQGSPNMTVAVAAGTVEVAGSPATVTGGNVTITAANGTNPRFDLVVVDNTGAKSAVAGTPAATPVFPAIPASRVVLAAVYVPTSDTAIESNQIVDKRVVLSSLRIFDVKNYGAIGDNVADDQTAFDAAVAAVEVNGGVLRIPPGTYKARLILTANKVIDVEGYGATLSVAAATIGIDIDRALGSQAIRLTISGLSTKASAEGDGSTAIRIQDTNYVRVRDCKFEWSSTGVHFKNVADTLNGCESNTIESCQIERCATGIKFESTGTAFPTFMNNYIAEVDINRPAIAMQIVALPNAPTTPFARCNFQYNTWLNENGVALDIDANITRARMVIGAENPLGALGTYCFRPRSSASGWREADIQARVQTSVTEVDLTYMTSGTTEPIVYWKNGTGIRAYRAPGTQQPNAFLGFRAGTETFDRVAFGIDSTGTPGLLFGGGTAAADASLRRTVAGIIYSPNQIRGNAGLATKYINGAGRTTVADGDFSEGVADGMFAIIRNSTDGVVRLAVRASSAWVYVVLA